MFFRYFHMVGTAAALRACVDDGCDSSFVQPKPVAWPEGEPFPQRVVVKPVTWEQYMKKGERERGIWTNRGVINIRRCAGLSLTEYKEEFFRTFRSAVWQLFIIERDLVKEAKVGQLHEKDVIKFQETLSNGKTKNKRKVKDKRKKICQGVALNIQTLKRTAHEVNKKKYDELFAKCDKLNMNQKRTCAEERELDKYMDDLKILKKYDDYLSSCEGDKIRQFSDGDKKMVLAFCDRGNIHD